MTWLWILIAIVAVVVVVALVMGARRSQGRKIERHREQAHELRDEASTAEVKAERDEAAAQETEAKARKARAEADQKAAEAVRLETVAKEQDEVAQHARADVDDKYRRADELDPDVTAATTAADRTPDSGTADAPPDDVRPAEDPRVTPTAPGTPAPTAYRDHTEDGTTTPSAETRTPDRDDLNGSAHPGKHADDTADAAKVPDPIAPDGVVEPDHARHAANPPDRTGADGEHDGPPDPAEVDEQTTRPGQTRQN